MLVVRRRRSGHPSGYFYFWTEEAADWIDRTVRVDKISALTLDQWVREFLRLKKLNAEMIGKAKRPGKTAVESKRK